MNKVFVSNYEQIWTIYEISGFPTSLPMIGVDSLLFIFKVIANLISVNYVWLCWSLNMFSNVYWPNNSPFLWVAFLYYLLIFLVDCLYCFSYWFLRVLSLLKKLILISCVLLILSLSPWLVFTLNLSF